MRELNLSVFIPVVDKIDNVNIKTIIKKNKVFEKNLAIICL